MNDFVRYVKEYGWNKQDMLDERETLWAVGNKERAHEVTMALKILGWGK